VNMIALVKQIRNVSHLVYWPKRKSYKSCAMCTASHYRRPGNLRRTFAMQDVDIMLSNSEDEQTDVNSDDAQCKVHAGADNDGDSHTDSDTGRVNDSEDDDLDAAARMLSDEVSSTLTFRQLH
jgi:hypothetical protein